jgi:hypothetical protein
MAHVTSHRRAVRPIGPARALRQIVSMLVALAALTLAAPAATPAAAQATPGTGAIEVHLSECPPGYDGQDIYADCHANGLAGVDVSIAGPTSDTKTTEGATGATRFGEIPAGTYTITVALPDSGQTWRTYCSPEDGDSRLAMTPPNANGAAIELGEGQAIVCDIAVVPPAGQDDGQQPPPQQDPPQQESPASLGSVTINAFSCVADTDPAAGYEGLTSACPAPAENITLTWSDASGPIETINTTDGDPANGADGQAVFDEIAPGSYTLFSDVPLEFAAERLFCVADGGSRYEKEFDATGVTAFADMASEQIVCDWFIVPENQRDDPVVTPTPGGSRGEETGASLTVHLALCPEDYDGEELYDTCHGEGIADQEFVLTGPGGEVSATTTVPQEPGPGIVEFTSLPAGDYTLAGGPPGDFGKVRLYCSTQPGGDRIDAETETAMASFTIGEGQDILCDWYFIPEDARGETTPTPAPSTAEIAVTLRACPEGETLAGATYSQFVNACAETRDGVSFSLADEGAPPLSAKTGASGPGAVRFYELLPGDYTLTPSLPDGLRSAGVFCRIDGGDAYQKTLDNGSTTFVNVDGEAIACDWFATRQAAQPQPAGPTGSITLREFLCEADKADVKDWERECAAGRSGEVFTLASTDGSISLSSATDANGVATFTNLPDGFYTLKQDEGMWCKAKAERVDSQSRVIVEGGHNTDVFIYQCAQVTDLPSTGTGPGIGSMDGAAWWSGLTTAQVALMGVGALGAMLLAGWGATRRLR